MKSALKEDEAVNNDVVGQAHIETVALKLFEFADTEDRAARFTRCEELHGYTNFRTEANLRSLGYFPLRNMIKAFFTASQLFTILKQFGELSDEVGVQ